MPTWQLVPLFDYVLVHSRPRAAFTVLQPILHLTEAGYDLMAGAWLLHNPSAAAAADAWEIGCFRVIGHAIDRWRELAAHAALHAAIAEVLSGHPPSAARRPDAWTVDTNLAQLLETAACQVEAQVWYEATASGYASLLTSRIRSLVCSSFAGGCHVAWASVAPMTGELSFYAAEQAWTLEASFAQLLLPPRAVQLQRSLRLPVGADKTVDATVHFHLSADDQHEAQVGLFQTTVGGGYRSVCRVPVPLTRQVELEVCRDALSGTWRTSLFTDQHGAATERRTLVQAVHGDNVVLALPHDA